MKCIGLHRTWLWSLPVHRPLVNKPCTSWANMELYETLGLLQHVDALKSKENSFLLTGKLCMLRCFKPSVLPMFTQLANQQSWFTFIAQLDSHRVKLI